MSPLIVYYSSPSGNTHRFVQALGIPSIRIPISMKEECPSVDDSYVLISPCYGNDDGSNAVPKQVIRFLNDSHNRSLIRGGIGAGNRNFGELFGYAGDVISKKCKVPLLYKFELSGTPTDIINVEKGMERLWGSLKAQSTVEKTLQKTGS